MLAPVNFSSWFLALLLQNEDLSKHRVIPSFMNSFDYRKFCSQIKALNKISLLLTNFTSNDKHNCGHLPHTNTKQIKFSNQDATVTSNKCHPKRLHYMSSTIRDKTK